MEQQRVAIADLHNIIGEAVSFRPLYKKIKA
jgi:hypothetical protein